MLILLPPPLMSALITRHDVIFFNSCPTGGVGNRLYLLLCRLICTESQCWGWAWADDRHGDICFCVADEKGQGQARATMVNLPVHPLWGKAECSIHRLCLASLFGRRAVNGVGYVFLVCAFVCVWIPCCVCMHQQLACLCLCLPWPCYLVCRIN